LTAVSPPTQEAGDDAREIAVSRIERQDDERQASPDGGQVTIHSNSAPIRRLDAGPGSGIITGAIHVVNRQSSVCGLLIRRMFQLSLGLLLGNPVFRSVLFDAVIV
jgi:hypothetical protein